MMSEGVRVLLHNGQRGVRSNVKHKPMDPALHRTCILRLPSPLSKSDESANLARLS